MHPGHGRAALESRESTGDDGHLAQTQPWLPLPVEGREPGQQHPQEKQQQVYLCAEQQALLRNVFSPVKAFLSVQAQNALMSLTC